MNQNLLALFIPLLLTGCLGPIISGKTGYIDEGYPDIRTVPVRKDAIAPRGLHEGEETVSRTNDLKKLEQDLQKTTERDKALREGFSTQTTP